MLVHVDGVGVQLFNLEGHQDGVEVPVVVAVVAVSVEKVAKIVGSPARQHDPHVEGRGPAVVLHPVGTRNGRVGQKPIRYPAGPEYVEVLVGSSVLLKNDKSASKEE